MLGVAMYTTIETLYKLGMNKSEIARSTGHDWKTVNKVIHHAQSGIPPPRKSLIPVNWTRIKKLS